MRPYLPHTGHSNARTESDLKEALTPASALRLADVAIESPLSWLYIPGPFISPVVCRAANRLDLLRIAAPAPFGGLRTVELTAMLGCSWALPGASCVRILGRCADDERKAALGMRETLASSW